MFWGRGNLPRKPLLYLRLAFRSGLAITLSIFFLCPLCLCGLKLLHAPAGKTLYLRNRGPGGAAAGAGRERLPGLLARGGFFLSLLRCAQRERGQGLADRHRSRPLLFGDPAQLLRMGGRQAPAGRLHGGFPPLPHLGGAAAGSRRDRHPHGARPGLRLRLPPHHPGLPDPAAPGL